jgi:hypothetical protein
MLQEIMRKLDDMSEHRVDNVEDMVEGLLEETQKTFIQYGTHTAHSRLDSEQIII